MKETFTKVVCEKSDEDFEDSIEQAVGAFELDGIEIKDIKITSTNNFFTALVIGQCEKEEK